jgi:hypothetical protein
MLMNLGQRDEPFPLYLDVPPASVSSIQGISLGLAREKLYLDLETFDAQNTVAEDDPMCQFLAELQDSVDEIRKLNGFPKVNRKPEQEPAACVQVMRAKMFRYLRTTVEVTLRPQKQLLFKTTGAAFQISAPELPLDANLMPVGSGNPMSIFGLPDNEISWDGFLKATAESKYSDSWRQAITSVISSSFLTR